MYTKLLYFTNNIDEQKSTMLIMFLVQRLAFMEEMMLWTYFYFAHSYEKCLLGGQFTYLLSLYCAVTLVCSNFSPASNGQRTIYKTHTTKVLQENIGFIFLEFHVFKTGTNAKANFSASFGIDMILYTSFIVIQFLQHSQLEIFLFYYEVLLATNHLPVQLLT